MVQSKKLKILVVEDNPGDFFLVSEYLQALGTDTQISQAQRMEDALRLTAVHSYDIILLDLSLPDSQGLDSMRMMLQHVNSTPLIVLTGAGKEQYGIDSLKLGAQDYLVKDEINASLLVKSVQYSIERSRVRMEMNRQDRLFRVITENSLIAKSLISPEGEILFCTRSVKNITGFDSHECIGKNERDLLHPEDVPILFRHISAALANPDHQPNFEVRVKHADGSYRWCEKSIVNLLHDEHVNALVCSFWDVTERREANEKIALSEQRFRSLVQNGGDMIALLDTDGVYHYVSDTVVQILGFTPGYFLQKKAWDFIHPEDVEIVYTQFRQLSEKIHIQLSPFRFRNSKGEWRWIETIITNQLNEPSVQGIVANSRDITEKIRAEEELRKMSIIARETTNAVIITDASGVTTWVNDAFSHITGYSFEEAVGLKPGPLLQGADSDPGTIAYMAQKIHDQEPFEADIINYSKAGKAYWVHIQCQPLLDENGQLQQFFAIETDITEKVLLEATLEQERQARQREITDAVLSAQEKERHELGIELHDNINQILASSRLYLGLAKNGHPDKSSYLEETDNLINAAIAEIRSLSHSLIPPTLGQTSLKEAIEQVIHSIRKTTGMKVRHEFGPLDESLLPDKLKLAIYRIIQEQFNNIIKYAAAGTVTVSLEEENGHTCLRIRDDGKGFDTATRQSGVGLKNMKTRASLFNGDLRVISAPGKGCLVEVYFPAGSYLPAE